MKTRLQEVFVFVVIVMSGKRCLLFEKTLFLHFETVHKVSLRPVMTAGSSWSDLQLKMNHTTMKLTFHQMCDLLRMVDKIVIFKKHVPFLTN